MNSEADHERPSHRHHRRRPYLYELFLSSVLHKILITKTRAHIILFFIIILSSMAICICYISHLHRQLDLATRDLLYHQTFDAECAAHPVPSARVRQAVIDRVFNGTSPWENFPPPHVAPLLRREPVVGWGSADAVFERLIRKVRPRTIIEVGTFLGASALHMAWLTDELGLNTQILCIDDFRGWAGPVPNVRSMETVNGDSMLLYQFMRNMVDANYTASVMFLPFSTKAALAALCEMGVYGDLVEVDADHDFHSAWVDINNAYKVLSPGGVIFGHDYLMDGVRHAVHTFSRLHGLHVRRDDDHWVMY